MPSRITPIPETVSLVPNYGNLTVYKILASRYWLCRCFLHRRYYKKSTKQTDKKKALPVAIEFYDSLRGGVFNQIFNNPPASVRKVFEKMCFSLQAEDAGRAAAGDISPKLVKNQQQLIDKDLLPFFGTDALKAITYQRISEYIAHVRLRGISNSTLKWHLTLLGKILRHACHKQELDHVPEFPSVSNEDKPREFFTKEEYSLLLKTVTQCVKVKAKVAAGMGIITDEMRLLTTFAVNTFLRPTDFKRLLVRECVIVKQGKTQYLRIMPMVTKTGSNKPYISMPDAVEIYNDLIKFNKAKGYGKPDDYLFFPEIKNRDYALRVMTQQFNHILETAKLKTSNSGVDKTLYSLRHTALHMRLIDSEGLDTLTLAKAANTSVPMLERFYLKGASVEQNIKKLHSMKKR